MNILFIMIPMAVILLAVAVIFFFWATNNKQFDDLDSPGYRILLDDEKDATMQKKNTSKIKKNTPKSKPDNSTT